jgi:hypothetical protein
MKCIYSRTGCSFFCLGITLTDTLIGMSQDMGYFGSGSMSVDKCIAKPVPHIVTGNILNIQSFHNSRPSFSHIGYLASGFPAIGFACSVTLEYIALPLPG